MALQAKDRGIAHMVSSSRVRPAQHDWGRNLLAPKLIAIAERAKQSGERLATATELGYGDLDLAALHQVLANIDPRAAERAALVDVA